MKRFCGCCALGIGLGLAITLAGAVWALLYGSDADVLAHF